MNFNEFTEHIKGMDAASISGAPIAFDISDFDTEIDFAKSMFFAGEFFSGEDEIIVRYSKPQDKKTGIVSILFEILRSKSKLFLKYLRNNDMNIVCIISSNKEWKECIKFFNSVGVKGEDMTPLSSKDSDYSSLFSEGVNEVNNGARVTISIERDKDSDAVYPMLSYEFLPSDGYSNFKETKAWVKAEILKINE